MERCYTAWTADWQWWALYEYSILLAIITLMKLRIL